jgi:D-alanyl-D-alanine carboxypeptidase (penicillin-binding protein 5/6)
VRALISLLSILTLAAPALAQQPFQTEATHAVIMDFDTGQILFDRDGDVAMPPASMSKLMTVLMAFEAIESGTLSLDDELPVSEYAWRTGGAASGSSTMFLEVNSRARVEDLLRGIIIQSGNDACIVIAEALAGSESAFADMMTDRARELGMENATFANSTGWPHPDHRISAADLARLARIMIANHPDLYTIWAEREFTYNGIRQFNRNPLLGIFDGADGLKTGHTEESGYGLVGTAVRNGERRIIVFNGMQSNSDRASEAERMMRAALSDFAVYDLFASGDAVDHQATVFMGEVDTVGVRVDVDVQIALHRRARRDMSVSVVYDGPLAAPVTEGDQIGMLVVEAPGYETQEFPLVAAETVARKGVMGRIGAAIAHMIRGGN